MAQPQFPRMGTINFFDTHLSTWEEAVDEPAMHAVLRDVISRLVHHRGFKFQQDPHTLKHYPSLAKSHFYGRKGDLECSANTCGRVVEFDFFQNVANIDHPNGGQYCSGKFRRMPSTMQLQCAVELAHVLRKFVELGYVLDGHRQGIINTDLLAVLRHAQGRSDEDDPLAAFNRQHNFESDWKRGGRYQCDPSGWPAESEYLCWPSRDRGGNPIRSGDVVYVRHHGRLFRGIARPNMNDMWLVISPATASAPAEVVCEQARCLFRCEAPDQEPRRLVPGQDERLERELRRAVQRLDFHRVATLATVLARRAPESHPQEAPACPS